MLAGILYPINLSDRDSSFGAGSVSEIRAAAEVPAPPHPHTRNAAWLGYGRQAVGGIDRRECGRAALGGCVFASHCPDKLGPVCDTTPPPFNATNASEAIACHLDIPLASAVPHQDAAVHGRVSRKGVDGGLRPPACRIACRTPMPASLRGSVLRTPTGADRRKHPSRLRSPSRPSR